MTIREHLEAILDRSHPEWTPGIAASKQHARAALKILDDAEADVFDDAVGKIRIVSDPEPEARA